MQQTAASRAQTRSRWARSVAAWPLALPWFGAFAVLAVEPTLAVLDAHAALVIAPLSAFAAGSAVRASLRATRAAAAGDATATARPPGALIAGAIIVALPAAQLALFGLWLPWCAPWTGVAQWLLVPTLSALVGACMALLADGLWPRRPLALWWLLALASAVGPIARLLLEPTVASWHVLLGFVPGAIYEDAFGPDSRLVAFRAVTTASWLGLAAAGQIASKLRARRASGAAGAGPLWRAAIADRRFIVAMTAAITAHIVGVSLGGELGYRVDRAEMLRKLPITVALDLEGDEAPEAIVHLAATPGWRRRAERLGEDVALRWLELRAFFGAAPRRQIEVFVYLDERQKSALMGADAVEMAKPWLGQAHLVDPGYGATILKHELAHVFGAALTDTALGVPLYAGVLPDALRIEGLAVAAEWPTRDGLDPHGQSRALQLLGLAPPLAELLAPSTFARHNAAMAYTLAGSWVRFVADRCGQTALGRYYDGVDADAACGAAPGTMVAAWQRFVGSERAGAPSEDALALARARFESPGVLARPCALETGRCARRAADAWRQGDAEAEVTLWRALRSALARHQRGAPLPLWQDLSWASALVRAGAQRDAEAVVEARLAAAPRDLDRAALLSARGDLALCRGDVSAARDAWRDALALPTTDAGKRTLLAKAALAGEPAGRRAVLDLFAIGRRRVDRRAATDALIAALPTHPWARYLDARAHLMADSDGDADGDGDDDSDGDSEAAKARGARRDALASIAADPRQPEVLRRECARLLAVASAREGACARVERYADLAGDDADVRHWREALLRRCTLLRTLASRRTPWRRVDGVER